MPDTNDKLPPSGDTYADYGSIPDMLKDSAKPTKLRIGDSIVDVKTWADALVETAAAVVASGLRIPFGVVTQQSKGAVHVGADIWIDSRVPNATVVRSLQKCADALDAPITVACAVKGSARPGFNVCFEPKKPVEAPVRVVGKKDRAPKKAVEPAAPVLPPTEVILKVEGTTIDTDVKTDEVRQADIRTTPDLWSDADPVWTKPPESVSSADLAGVGTRRRLGGRALLRDALLLGRVWRASVAATRPTSWITDVTGYKKRRLQDFRLIADALDGLVAGVTIPKVPAKTDGGSTEPPVRWLDEGVDAALMEVRQLSSRAKAKAEAAIVTSVQDEENRQPQAKRDALALAKARARFGKGTWDDDIAGVSKALSACPVFAEEMVDAVVDLLVSSLGILTPEARLVALGRARDAITKAEAAVTTTEVEPEPQPAEPDGDALDDFLGGVQ